MVNGKSVIYGESLPMVEFVRSNKMKKWILTLILVCTFTGGYVLSSGIHYYTDQNGCNTLRNQKNNDNEFHALIKSVTSFAFKVNVYDEDNTLLGVGYVPMYKLRDLSLAYTDAWYNEDLSEDTSDRTSLISNQTSSKSIPTIDMNLISHHPVENEYEIFRDYCEKLLPKKTNIRFTP
jgi:hypothetical protein